MMSSKTGPVPEHELTQYLLGNLHGEQCERLDELSVADDEFAQRLCAVEHDLVDAYVRDGLRSDELRDFESHYLATDGRREKVAMARALYLAGARLDSSAGSELSIANSNASAALNPRSPRWMPRLRFAWLALTAGLILALTTTWLLVENRRLRQQDRASRTANGALEAELRQLRTQVENEQALQNRPPAAVEKNSVRVIDPPQRLTSLFLMPPHRGAATIPAASVTESDRWLRLQLALESDDFSLYEVGLMDLGTNRYVWHSGPVKSADVNRRRALALVVPVGRLKPQRYAAELSGIAADGRREVLGSYVFSIAQAASE